jgi:hypothetical protein
MAGAKRFERQTSAYRHSRRLSAMNVNGWFIPNKENKYSVGQNAGYRLNADGGIETHIATDKPTGVPPENWLPINRADQGISPMLRLYAPDLAKAKTWKLPKAQLGS